MNTSPEINSKPQAVASWSSAHRLAPRISNSELCSVYDDDICKWSSKNTVSCENIITGLCGAVLTSEHFLFWDKTTWLCFYLKAVPKQCVNHFLWKRVNCRPSAHHLTPGQVHSDPLPQDVCFSAAGFLWNRDQLPLISSQSRCGGDAGESGLRLFFKKTRIHHAKID